MKWWKWLGLRTRLYIIVATLMLITLGGGVIMIWYTYRMESLCSSIIDRNVVAIHSVDAIQFNLVNQKGFVSYYFIDGNPYWLDQLKSYRIAFLQNLNEAKEFRLSKEQADLIKQIEQQYTLYVAAQDHVISLFKAGNRENGLAIHEKIRFHFFEIIDLCKKYKEIQVEELNAAWEKTHEESVQLRVLASTAILLATVMFTILALVLLFEILRPIKMLANEASHAGDKSKSTNEVAALGHRVRNLIEDVKQTRIELEQSRARLLQSAKMAAIGRFSAEMAHTIRNPMASIEMRLYSIEQKIELTDAQKEDFEAIYDDMNFLDNFIRNFLEFSRPPNLKKQEIYISDILDTTLQLIEPQLNQLNINVERDYPDFQPYLEADPELLKEVFVNLIVNACEAMGDKGHLIISEEIVKENQGIKAVVVRIKDNGPGIPLSDQDKLWEPFFTTKEEGTGLGLSIAMRIIEEHGGKIEVESEEGSGAAFIITLPVLPIEE